MLTYIKAYPFLYTFSRRVQNVFFDSPRDFSAEPIEKISESYSYSDHFLLATFLMRLFDLVSPSISKNIQRYLLFCFIMDTTNAYRLLLILFVLCLTCVAFALLAIMIEAFYAYILFYRRGRRKTCLFWSVNLVLNQSVYVAGANRVRDEERPK